MSVRSTLPTLATLIDAMAHARVLCLGDAMLDRFVEGSVERISPEAPIPVLRVAGERLMPGGAGNVAANLAALGAAADVWAVVGDDEAGRTLGRLLDTRTRASTTLVVEPGRDTSVKTRYTAAGQQLLRADRETLAPLGTAAADAALVWLSDRLAAAGALVLSDYGKGVLTETVTGAAIAGARSAGRPVIVDPKGPDYRRYRGASVITPNRRELAEATGLPTATDCEVETAAGVVIESCDVEAVVATRSEQGLSVIGAGRPPLHLRAEAREVFDVSGAGDTVAATLGAALAAGARLDDAARLANVAGGIVVGKAGTAVVAAADLRTALHHEAWARGEAKVALDLEDAARRVALWRSDGRRIGFTNGCFDLLHPGHLSLMRQCRGACDRLVVGLNSDASVSRLKGPGRPVQSEAARAAVLASLEAVDLVIVFTEDTPLQVIERLRPDVLVKGADYRREQVVGGDLVESYGGEVRLATLAPGHSTSATIARLRS